jgi:hypothetical protein
MEFFSENILWLFGAYVAGSVATYLLMLKATFIDAADKTIDTLIEAGYIRTRKNKDGELELLRWDFKDE